MTVRTLRNVTFLTPLRFKGLTKS